MTDPFFKNLKEKLTTKREADFDAQFWDRFEKEFPKQRKWKLPSLLLTFPTPQLAGFFAAALVVLWVSWPSEELGPLQAAQLIESQEFFEMSDLLVEIDLAGLSEEEWTLLLGEEDDG